MAPKNTGDQGENPDKLNFSKTQLTVIIGSIAAIVVLALALGFLTRKNQAKLDEQTKVEAPPIEQATELPPSDGAKKEELSKLEETLPKQVPQTPAEELKQKAEKKAESAPPAATPAPATPAPTAPQKSAATPPAAAAAPAPAPGAIIEKTAPKPTVKVEEKNAEPAKEKKAKREKPKKKRIHDRQRKTLEPLKKQVDVKKINAAPKAEPRKEPKEAAAPVKETKPALPAQVRASSFTTEIKPDTVPPAPATVDAPAPPPPAPAAPKAVEAKAAEPKAAESKTAEPKFTILAETVASEADAKSRVAALKQSGYQAHYLKKVTTKNTWYHVMTGAYATREEAEAAAAEFGKKERTAAKVLPYEKP